EPVRAGSLARQSRVQVRVRLHRQLVRPAVPEARIGPAVEGAYSSYLYNYRLIYQNGAPFQIEVWNNPAYAKVVTHYLGTYVTDGWNIGRRLTLNLGIRFAHDNGFVPGSCVEAADPPGNIAFPATCY